MHCGKHTFVCEYQRFAVPAEPGALVKLALKDMCVCVCLCLCVSCREDYLLSREFMKG